MVSLRQLVIDAWSWLSYKPVMAELGRPGARTFPELAASWLPEEDLRRLAAYKVLAAYDNNQAGQLAAAGGEGGAAERRELGDASKIVETVVAHVLGSEQGIVVPGAEDADEGSPSPEAARASEVQERLRQWAEQEQFPLKVQQAERAAALLGDAVFVLAWKPDKGRPRLRTLDPGFYFPQWDDELDEDFPHRVHFAWELPADPARGLKTRVRRVTYELGPVRGAETGEAVRHYPWGPGEGSGVTCYLTDAEWLLEDLRQGQTVDRLPLERATFRVRPDGQVLDHLDLMIDFLPVVHLPNTVPQGGEQWGQPVLAKVLQGLDELAATDSDSAAASATTGTPIIGLAGARLPVNRSTGEPTPLKVQAGAVWQLGESGRMDALDTSSQLAELRARVEHLLDRVAANSRVTSAGLGMLDASEVPSGYALRLSLAPLEALVGQMRLVREYKYRLLLKMVQRLYMAGRVAGWGSGASLPARLVRSSTTLTDRAAVLEEVVSGYQAGVFSLETAVRMLMAAGYPIDDASQEIARIESRSNPQETRHVQEVRFASGAAPKEPPDTGE